jgi:hypothetical protein
MTLLQSLFETYFDLKCDPHDDPAAFYRRLKYMRKQGLAPFSFWAAKQVGTSLSTLASFYSLFSSLRESPVLFDKLL